MIFFVLLVLFFFLFIIFIVYGNNGLFVDFSFCKLFLGESVMNCEDVFVILYV